jgi:hypothetical protein
LGSSGLGTALRARPSRVGWGVTIRATREGGSRRSPSLPPYPPPLRSRQGGTAVYSARGAEQSNQPPNEPPRRTRLVELKLEFGEWGGGPDESIIPPDDDDESVDPTAAPQPPAPPVGPVRGGHTGDKRGRRVPVLRRDRRHGRVLVPGGNAPGGRGTVGDSGGENGGENVRRKDCRHQQDRSRNRHNRLRQHKPGRGPAPWRDRCATGCSRGSTPGSGCRTWWRETTFALRS